MKKLALAVLAVYIILAVTGFSWSRPNLHPQYTVNYFPRPVYQLHKNGLQLACWLMPFERYIESHTYTAAEQGGPMEYVQSERCYGLVK